MIARSADLARVRTALSRSPVVLLVGPRQAGKSTLARVAAGDEPASVFDLENPSHAARLSDPMLALEALQGLVVIDEAQHAPDLFPILRVLADRHPRPARFLVLGSASPELVGLGAESLAGRVEIIDHQPDVVERHTLGEGLSHSFAGGIDRQIVTVASDVDGPAAIDRRAAPAFVPAAQLLQQGGGAFGIADGDVGVFKKACGHGFRPFFDSGHRGFESPPLHLCNLKIT
jgi:hypothetical protein